MSNQQRTPEEKAAQKAAAKLRHREQGARARAIRRRRDETTALVARATGMGYARVTIPERLNDCKMPVGRSSTSWEVVQKVTGGNVERVYHPEHEPYGRRKFSDVLKEMTKRGGRERGGRGGQSVR